jgi:hercynylcysteine S-oxide lyase
MAALEFRNWLGGEAKINAYCHDMAVKGGRRLAEIFGTRVMDPEGDLTVNMVCQRLQLPLVASLMYHSLFWKVNVALPMPADVKFSKEIDGKFKEKMLTTYKAYSAHFYHNNAWWTRCSAQVWTEVCVMFLCS